MDTATQQTTFPKPVSSLNFQWNGKVCLAATICGNLWMGGQGSNNVGVRQFEYGNVPDAQTLGDMYEREPDFNGLYEVQFDVFYVYEATNDDEVHEYRRYDQPVSIYKIDKKWYWENEVPDNGS